VFDQEVVDEQHKDGEYVVVQSQAMYDEIEDEEIEDEDYKDQEDESQDSDADSSGNLLGFVESDRSSSCGSSSSSSSSSRSYSSGLSSASLHRRAMRLKKQKSPLRLKRKGNFLSKSAASFQSSQVSRRNSVTLGVPRKRVRRTILLDSDEDVGKFLD